MEYNGQPLKRDNPDFHKIIGGMGGRKNVEINGVEHLAKIGMKGGKKRLSQIGRKGYADMGRMARMTKS